MVCPENFFVSTHIITLREVTGLDDEIAIRPVDTWDKDEIVQLYRVGGWWKDEYDPDSLPGLIRGSFAFAVAIDRKTGHAIGMGRVISDGVFDGYIQDLVVLPAYPEEGDRCRDYCGSGRSMYRFGNLLDRAHRGTRHRVILPAPGVLSDERVYSPAAEEGSMMLTQDNFRPVTLADREFFEKHYAHYPQVHSDNTFTNMVCWNHYASYSFAYVEKNVVIASTIGSVTRFRAPIGPRNRHFSGP